MYVSTPISQFIPPHFSPREFSLHQKIKCCRSTQSHMRKIYSTTRTRLGFPQGSMVKNSLLMQETRVQSLGQEDAQEKGIATHSSTLAWKIPWLDGGAWRAIVHEVAKTERPHFLFVSSKTKQVPKPTPYLLNYFL